MPSRQRLRRLFRWNMASSICAVVTVHSTVYVELARATGVRAERNVAGRGVAGPADVNAGDVCIAEWSHGFHTPELPMMLSLAVFDDGNGPALYAGGEFERAWDTLARTVVKWDGDSWSALPATFGPYSPLIDEIPVARAMLAFDDGTGTGLFVAGCFRTAGEIVVNTIAKWDGAAWSALGDGIDSGYSCTSWGWSPTVNALAVFDDGTGPALYAAGDFGSADGAPASNIARWDGATWSSLGQGIDGRVYALASFDDGGGARLYAGGDFATAGGTGANAIAKWDGNAWSPVSTGMDGQVYALAVYDDGGGPALYAGGSFGMAGGVPATNIAKWDGLSWSQPGGDALADDLGVRTLAVYGGGANALYAGGYFNQAGGAVANQIARWDGQTWSGVGGGMAPQTASVTTMIVFNRGDGTRLYVSGNFNTAGGVDARGMAQWDGNVWAPMQGSPGSGLNDWVLELEVDHTWTFSGLYAGGWFTEGGGLPLNYIGRWAGGTWSSLGIGMDDIVVDITFFDDGSGTHLYAGGSFTMAGGVPASHVARWNGSHWEALGAGVTDPESNANGVLAVAGVDDGSAQGFYAAGNFREMDGVPVNRIAHWDGVMWSDVGGGVTYRPLTLTSHDDGNGPQLYAGGSFSEAGGVPANNVARWDGASWWPVGDGLPDDVNKLEVIDDGGGPALYAAWNGGISRWTGDNWDMIGEARNHRVFAIGYYHDGTNGALFAAGYFFTIDGVNARHIAKWDGSNWWPLEGSVDYAIYDLATYNAGRGPGLFAGGTFRYAGDTVSLHLAKWYSPCLDTGPVPALSDWGVAIMALLLIAVASAILVRRTPARPARNSPGA